MIAYYVILMYFLKNIIIKKTSKIIKKIEDIILLIFLSFSYYMGTDWLAYREIYNNIEDKNKFINTKIEMGYLLYNLLMKKIFRMDYTIFMGVTLFICAAILLKELRERSVNKELATFIYLSLYLYNACIEPVVRQLIATTIIIYALKYIDRQKIFRYLLFILIASQFHKTAIIFLGLYFLDKLNLNLKNTIFFVIVSIVAIENIEVIFSLFSKLVPGLQKFEFYFTNTRYGQRSINLVQIIKRLIMSSMYIYIVFFAYDYYFQKKNYIKNAAILFCIILNLQYKLNILYRFQNYLSFFLAIVLSSVGYVKILNKRKTSFQTILPIIYLIFFSSIFYKSITNSELNKFRYGNYKNYFIEILKGNRLTEKKVYIYQEKVMKMIYEEDNK
ncbi:EpsG family protein [Cetobacterium sp. ZOR0034]|uniref:EpsG family protein n=1 Tax=Cetobacterium sp. ZOR0034 TaxID=1339239 RepID=UPI0006455DE6|nr:EpsG family protein [Cetobacterium sp. ZOR0034]